jgi:peptidoglycan/xylan/chitin deacetylase (PgdA/CDA1 family)
MGWNPEIVAGASLAGLTVAGTLAYATLSAQSQIFGPTLRYPPRVNDLALTFDDGPNPAATPQLLDVLARHHATATFFLIGNFVRLEPALTRRIAAAGHSIGNHTLSHPFLPRHSAARIRAELAGCNAALEDTLGARIELFRPPHGAVRPVVLRAARELGLTTVQWNLIVGDWSAGSIDLILHRLQQGIARNQSRGRGTNVVLHDGGQAGPGQSRLPTVNGVDRLLSGLTSPPRFVVPTPSGWSLPDCRDQAKLSVAQ